MAACKLKLKELCHTDVVIRHLCVCTATIIFHRKDENGEKWIKISNTRPLQAHINKSLPFFLMRWRKICSSHKNASFIHKDIKMLQKIGWEKNKWVFGCKYFMWIWRKWTNETMKVFLVLEWCLFMENFLVRDE